MSIDLYFWPCWWRTKVPSNTRTAWRCHGSKWRSLVKSLCNGFWHLRDRHVDVWFVVVGGGLGPFGWVDRYWFDDCVDCLGPWTLHFPMAGRLEDQDDCVDWNKMTVPSLVFVHISIHWNDGGWGCAIDNTQILHHWERTTTREVGCPPPLYWFLSFDWGWWWWMNRQERGDVNCWVWDGWWTGDTIGLGCHVGGGGERVYRGWWWKWYAPCMELKGYVSIFLIHRTVDRRHESIKIDRIWGARGRRRQNSEFWNCMFSFNACCRIYFV